MINQKPDIVVEIEKHIKLKKRGRYLWGLCPFPGHLEKTPSFKVDPEHQTCFCFGCNRGGDVIAFIQHLENLSFKDALRYLGIKGGSYKPDPREIKKKELVKQFTRWCSDYHDKLCTLYRDLQNAKLQTKTMQEVETLSDYYHTENLWLNQIEVLTANDDRAKLELFKEIYG